MRCGMGCFLLAAWRRRRWSALAAAAAAALAPAALGASASSSGQLVTYVLRGTLSQYIAPGTSVVGSVTITVSDTNRQRQALSGMRLTLAVDGRTRVAPARAALKDGVAATVVVRGPADDPAALRGRTALEVTAHTAGGAKSSDSKSKKPKTDGDAAGGKGADGGGDKSGGDKGGGDKSGGDKGSGDNGPGEGGKEAGDKGGGDGSKSQSSGGGSGSGRH
jgi:hypothetical protein